MPLFQKKDDHPGSGIDKPEARGLVEKVVDKMKAAAKPSLPPKSPPAP